MWDHLRMKSHRRPPWGSDSEFTFSLIGRIKWERTREVVSIHRKQCSPSDSGTSKNSEHSRNEMKPSTSGVG